MNSFQKKLLYNQILAFLFCSLISRRTCILGLKLEFFYFPCRVRICKEFLSVDKGFASEQIICFFWTAVFFFWRQWTNLLKKLWQLFPSCYHFQTLHRNFLNHLVQIEHVGPKESHGMGSGSHCKNHWYRQILAILLI